MLTGSADGKGGKAFEVTSSNLRAQSFFFKDYKTLSTPPRVILTQRRLSYL
jgi:hypothetical protein